MRPESPGPAHDGSGVADHVPVIERMGNEIAALRQELDRQKQIVADLMRRVEQFRRRKNVG